MRPPMTPAAIIAKQGPNARVDALGHRVCKQTAPLVTLALTTIRAELEDSAPYVGSGDTSAPRVSGGGRVIRVEEDESGPAEDVPVTIVEAAALRSELVRDMREEIRDRIDGIVVAVASLDAFCRRVAGEQAAEVPTLCDGRSRGYDGHLLPWSAQAKGAGRGWHDPGCRDIAGPTGLCPRCLVRMNRWRSANNLPPIGVSA